MIVKFHKMSQMSHQMSHLWHFQWEKWILDDGIFWLGPTLRLSVFIDNPRWQKSSLNTSNPRPSAHSTYHDTPPPQYSHLNPLPHPLYFTVIESSSPLPTYITSKQHPRVQGPWLWECLRAGRFRASLLLCTICMRFHQLGGVSGVVALQTNKF